MRPTALVCHLFRVWTQWEAAQTQAQAPKRVQARSSMVFRWVPKPTAHDVRQSLTVCMRTGSTLGFTSLNYIHLTIQFTID